jgi:F0F1-type ATP synthase assembly protein I
MKYLGLGMQITATMVLGIIAGQILDHYLETQRPVFTIILASIAIIVAIYQLIKPFLKR